MFKKLRHRLEDLHWEEAAELSWWWRFGRRQVRLFFYIMRELLRDRCLQQAAALTFTTLLALVPLFAVAFSFFRGFAATEGLEERVRESIFRAVFAAPLVEPAPSAGAEAAASAAGPPVAAELAAMPPEQIQARARKLFEQRDYAGALQRYVAALNAGGAAAQFREDVARLPLSQLSDLPRTFQAMNDGARKRYLTDAGLAPPPAGGWTQPNPSGEQAFRLALTRQEAGDERAAIEALRQAEDYGYDPARTRAVAGAVRLRMASVAAQEDPAASVDGYNAALKAYADAAVLASLYGTPEEVGEDMPGYRASRQGLAGALFARGRQEADLYLELAARSAQAAGPDHTLESALADLQWAADLMVDSSKVHRRLAELLWTAGRQDEARREYEAALAVAGAGRISESVVDRIRTFIDRVGTAGIGMVGSLFLLVTAISLLSTIEATLNHIWKVTEKRPFWVTFTSYCTLIWLGPALIGLGIWAREQLGHYTSALAVGLPVVGYAVAAMSTAGRVLLPFALTWLALVAIYRYLPHTRVKFATSAWGAALAAVLLQLARPLFSIYVVHAVRYERIYGSLAAIPIFLLWIWLLWLIVLFGAEVTFTVQNVGLLRYHDKLRQISHVFIDRYLAMRIMMYVAREFWQSAGPVSANRLAEIMEIPVEEADDAAHRLVRLGLLTRVGEGEEGFYPARDLSRLKVSEVLSVTDRYRDESRSASPENRPYEDKLESVFRTAIESQDAVLKQMTFRDLLSECDPQAGERAGGEGGM